MDIVIIPELKGSLLGVYDSSSKDAKSLVADKVIDISGMCSTVKEQAVVKYARCSDGRTLIQLKDCSKKDKDIGSSVHFLCEKNEEDTLSTDPTFIKFSARWGIGALKLAQIILADIPEKENESGAYYIQEGPCGI